MTLRSSHLIHTATTLPILPLDTYTTNANANANVCARVPLFVALHHLPTCSASRSSALLFAQQALVKRWESENQYRCILLLRIPE